VLLICCTSVLVLVLLCLSECVWVSVCVCAHMCVIICACNCVNVCMREAHQLYQLPVKHFNVICIEQKPQPVKYTLLFKPKSTIPLYWRQKQNSFSAKCQRDLLNVLNQNVLEILLVRRNSGNELLPLPPFPIVVRRAI